MPFDWEKTLRVAERLTAEAQSAQMPMTRESLFRAAINRAYYASYNLARNYCIARGMSFGTGRSAHQAVQDAMYALGHSELGYSLHVTHEWRKNADYRNEDDFDWEWQAAEATSLAQEFVTLR